MHAGKGALQNWHEPSSTGSVGAMQATTPGVKSLQQATATADGNGLSAISPGSWPRGQLALRQTRDQTVVRGQCNVMYYIEVIGYGPLGRRERSDAEQRTTQPAPCQRGRPTTTTDLGSDS